jgi:hypothetical protein
MEKYKLDRVGSEIKETGYVQEGYESILPFNSWLTLCKITLTKPKYIQETLDMMNLSSLQDLKEFVETCEEQGLDDFETDYESSEYSLDYFRIVCSRNTTEKKTDNELKSEYYAYANKVLNNNINSWKNHIAFIEKEKKEYAQYLLLKEKYEGKK